MTNADKPLPSMRTLTLVEVADYEPTEIFPPSPHLLYDHCLPTTIMKKEGADWLPCPAVIVVWRKAVT